MAYRINCHRTSGSIFGEAEVELKQNGVLYETENIHDAIRKCTVLNNETTTTNIYYTVSVEKMIRRIEHKRGETTMPKLVTWVICFAGCCLFWYCIIWLMLDVVLKGGV